VQANVWPVLFLVSGGTRSPMSLIGTKRTSGDVRYMVANGVRADMALTSRFGRE
jgi:hypothetical protein